MVLCPVCCIRVSLWRQICKSPSPTGSPVLLCHWRAFSIPPPWPCHICSAALCLFSSMLTFIALVPSFTIGFDEDPSQPVSSLWALLLAQLSLSLFPPYTCKDSHWCTLKICIRHTHLHLYLLRLILLFILMVGNCSIPCWGTRWENS